MPQLNDYRSSLSQEQIFLIVDGASVERKVYLAQMRGLSQRVCQICLRDDVKRIDGDILSQMSVREVSEKYKCNPLGITHHWQRHVRPVIRTALGAGYKPGEYTRTMAKKLKTRGSARFDMKDRKKQLEFILEDLAVAREAYFGDIDQAGQIFKSPNLAQVLRIDQQMLDIMEKIEDLEQARKQPPAKPSRKADSTELDEELVPKDQQNEIDRMLEKERDKLNGQRPDAAGTAASGAVEKLTLPRSEP